MNRYLLVCFLAVIAVCQKETIQQTSKGAAIDQKLDYTARYLAGLDETEKAIWYQSHKRNLDRLYNTIESEHASRIREWKNKNYNTDSIDTVLYMFSGVDLTNLSIWYPQATTYIMVSLEEPGNEINLEKMTETEKKAALEGLYGSIATLSRFNYLMTRTMRWKLSNNPIRGVQGVLLLQLARQNRRIISVDNLKLNTGGTLTESSEPTTYIRPGNLQSLQRDSQFEPDAIRIRFLEKNSGIEKKLIFLRLWISDELLRKNASTARFFQQLPAFACMLKSASYYLHRPQSQKLARFLADNAISINQDDSGIPFRYFSEEKHDIKLFGQYYGAARLGDQPFHPDQPQLMKRYSEKEPTVLPFVYGYGKIQRSSNLQIIRSKKIAN